MSNERDSKQRIVFVQLFSEASASEAVPSEMHVVPTGTWDHPVYGEIEITAADIAEFVQNFSRGVRLDIPITESHDNGMSGGELPTIGWFTELIDRGASGLYAKTKWTDEGMALVSCDCVARCETRDGRMRHHGRSRLSACTAAWLWRVRASIGGAA